MSITRGEFLRSLSKSLPGMVASTGLATAAGALVSRLSQAVPLAGAAKASAGINVPFWTEGPARNNQIALTFDDGPVPGVTDRILDTLKEHKALATFFMIGRQIAAAPDLARRVLAEGHEIGNHTYAHQKMTQLSDVEAAAEIEKTEAIMSDTLGYRSAWFRPPYGALRQDQAAMAARRGMNIGMWTIDTGDWQIGFDPQFADTILGPKLKAGTIIVCHDRPRTADLIPPILEQLGTRGYKLVTLSRLMESVLPQAA